MQSPPDSPTERLACPTIGARSKGRRGQSWSYPPHSTVPDSSLGPEEPSMTAASSHPSRLARSGEGRSPTGSPHLFKASASSTDGRFDFSVGVFAPLTAPPL